MNAEQHRAGGHLMSDSHELRVETGDVLGDRVWWAACDCGWIGIAMPSAERARSFGQRRHTQGRR